MVVKIRTSRFESRGGGGIVNRKFTTSELRHRMRVYVMDWEG